MKRWITAQCILAFTLGMAFGQAGPAFDVASVKVDTVGINEGPGRGMEDVQHTPNSLTMRNVRLSTCIRWAYGLNESQVSGPDSINSERYDIAAKTGRTVDESQMKLMLQALLAERFHLAFHKQAKELSIFTLNVARNGPKLKESAEGGEGVQDGNMMKLSAQRTTMEQLASMLSRLLGSAVVDATGLKGKYDFEIDLRDYIPEKCRDAPCGIAEVNVPNMVVSAIQTQLGLRLDSKKQQAEVYIVDHADRSPVEN